MLSNVDRSWQKLIELTELAEVAQLMVAQCVCPKASYQQQHQHQVQHHQLQ
jgi:hypothetical protein